MIQVMCDKCGSNCNRVGFEIRVSVIENPTPIYALDIGDLKIASDNTKYRFILCQKCFHRMGFPNPYKVCDSGKLEFREVKTDIGNNPVESGEMSYEDYENWTDHGE